MKYDDLIKKLRSYAKTEKDALDHFIPKLAMAEAADAIEELTDTNVGKWIPVTERLPDVHKNVLCCGSKGGQFVGWVSNHVSDGKATAFVHGGSGRLITHWMPLPEPPKEEK